MKIRIRRTVIIICSFIFLFGCGKSTYPAEMPDDFAFVIQFNHSFSVDTDTNTLSERNLYDSEIEYAVEFHFTDEQMENIYAEFLRLNIDKIEDGEEVGQIQTIPPTGVYFTYSTGGESITISCSDNYISPDGFVSRKKKNFVKFTDFIIAYIKESSEYKNAPHIFYGWE